MRLHRGAILAVIVDVETRGIAQADRRRSAGVCAIPALADALYGDALGAEADGNRPEILRDVVDELAVGRQINNLLIDNPVMHPMPRRPTSDAGRRRIFPQGFTETARRLVSKTLKKIAAEVRQRCGGRNIGIDKRGRRAGARRKGGVSVCACADDTVATARIRSKATPMALSPPDAPVSFAREGRGEQHIHAIQKKRRLKIIQYATGQRRFASSFRGGSRCCL